MQKNLIYFKCLGICAFHFDEVFGSGLDPDSYGIADPDWDPDPGRPKLPSPPKKKNLIFEVFSVGPEASSGPECLFY